MLMKTYINKTKVILLKDKLTLADFRYPVQVLLLYCSQNFGKYLALQSFNSFAYLMILKTLHRKLKIEQHETHSKPLVHSCAPDEQVVPAPYVAPVMLFLLQNSGELMCSGRVGSPCSICGTRDVILATNKGVFNDNELNMCDECQKKNKVSMLLLNYRCMYFFTKINKLQKK